MCGLHSNCACCRSVSQSVSQCELEIKIVLKREISRGVFCCSVFGWFGLVLDTLVVARTQARASQIRALAHQRQWALPPIDALHDHT